MQPNHHGAFAPPQRLRRPDIEDQTILVHRTRSSQRAEYALPDIAVLGTLRTVFERVADARPRDGIRRRLKSTAPCRAAIWHALENADTVHNGAAYPAGGRFDNGLRLRQGWSRMESGRRSDAELQKCPPTKLRD
jgi:hypothetical protein